MKNKKKIIIYLIIFLGVLLLVAGATYTWFKWRSSNNTNVRITINNTSDLVITFDGGSNVTGTLEPTITKEEGIVKNFSASTNGLDVPMNIWLKINTLPDALKDSTFKWELYRDGVYLNSGSFDGSEITTRTSGNTTDYNLVNNNIVGSTTVNYTLYLWIDGNVDNNLDMAGKSFDFDLYATVSSKMLYEGGTAAEYITSLYNGATKTEILHNDIKYGLVPSESLMNDRLGGTTESLVGGNIRYYGSKPNNYVWLGDTYTSAYSYSMGTINIRRKAGDKKLWRIIGVFDGRLKLISNDLINPLYLAWDKSNGSGGENDWTKADLMKLLNPGFDNNEVLGTNNNPIISNNSLYWNKGSGYVVAYTQAYSNYAKPTEISFENTGLSIDEQNMVDTVIWQLGGISSSSDYVEDFYINERQDDNEVWNGKVGLIYPSDYGYAMDLSNCNETLYNYDRCYNDWLKGNNIWTITKLYSESDNNDVFITGNNGYLGYSSSSNTLYVYASIYLKPSVVISKGLGTENNPYVLSLNS